MKYCRALLTISIAVLMLSNSASAEPFAPSAERGMELVAELGLGPDQVQRTHALFAEARKQAIRSRADIEISSIDLALELDKESPDERVVAKLVESMSKVEGQWRRSRILTWVKIRKLLNANQRGELKRLRIVSGRNIVKTQGEFINPFSNGDSSAYRHRKRSNVLDPFERAPKEKAPPGLAAIRSRVRITTKKPAEIYVDSKLRGVSPLSLRLTPGKHRIRSVFLDGSPPQMRTVNLKAGSTRNIVIRQKPKILLE
jgi:hypothetical protein